MFSIVNRQSEIVNQAEAGPTRFLSKSGAHLASRNARWNLLYLTQRSEICPLQKMHNAFCPDFAGLRVGEHFVYGESDAAQSSRRCGPDAFILAVPRERRP